jgi:hypothetical protein
MNDTANPMSTGLKLDRKDFEEVQHFPSQQEDGD